MNKSKRFYKDELGRWFKRYETGAVMVTDEWLIDTLDIKDEETKSNKEAKNWYYEGDELVITKGKWVIDRYRKHQVTSPDTERQIREEAVRGFAKHLEDLVSDGRVLALIGEMPTSIAKTYLTQKDEE